MKISHCLVSYTIMDYILKSCGNSFCEGRIKQCRIRMNSSGCTVDKINLKTRIFFAE
jgi:hypothetical protein